MEAMCRTLKCSASLLIVRSVGVGPDSAAEKLIVLYFTLFKLLLERKIGRVQREETEQMSSRHATEKGQARVRGQKRESKKSNDTAGNNDAALVAEVIFIIGSVQLQVFDELRDHRVRMYLHTLWHRPLSCQ